MAGILIISLVPKISNKMIFIPLCFLWILFAFMSSSRCIIVTFIKPSVKNYSIYIWLIFYIIFYLLGDTGGFEAYFFNYVRIGFSILLINYYIELKDYHVLSRFAIISILIICFVCITTIKVLVTDKDAVRLLSTGIESLTENIHGIVGSFGFIYGLVFICISIIGCFVEKIITKYKVIWIIILGLMLFTIYKASFMIALILLCSISILIFLRVDKSHNFLMIFVLFIFVFVIGAPLISKGLMLIASSIKNTDLSMRFCELSEFLITGSTENTVDMGIRINLDMISIKSFLSNPLFGVGGFYGYDSACFGIGGHSGFLDELARYGILGTLPLFIGLIENMKYVYAKLNTKTKNVYSKCIIGFFILGFINTIFFIPLIIIVFFVAPALLFYFKENESKEYYKNSTQYSDVKHIK